MRLPFSAAQPNDDEETGFVLTAPAVNPKALAKRALRATRRRWIRTFHSFDAARLEQALRRVGVSQGDTVLMHSSFDAFEGYTGKPTEVILAIQRILTEQGTLLLPTMPFTGTAVAHAERNPVFDPVRTPSRMGLLTELFRRTPGVVRSLHPTHPVAAWGRDAKAVVEGHELAQTPCGKPSPFFRLLERNGKILLLGTDISSLTFFHTLEEMLETELPVQPFTQKTFALTTRLADGKTVTTNTRLYEPAISRRRNIFKIVPYLRAAGSWRAARVGIVSIVLLRAEDVLAAARSMLANGQFCYD